MAVRVTPTQVRWFRFRRSGLAEPFRTPEETAHRLIGVQAQLPPAAALAFRNRTSGCTASGLDEARLAHRSLVRFWGQRNTVHVYCTDDWPFLHTVFAGRHSTLHRRLDAAGLLADFRRVVARMRKRLAAGERLTYKDVRSRKLESEAIRWRLSYVAFMQLVREGVACHGPDKGPESGFVHREHWLPDLAWSPPDADLAFPELARRYLGAYGPAEASDLAFWYGTTIRTAGRWIESAGESCAPVAVGDRTLWALADDVEELAGSPPPAGRWPVRLLHRFDPLLLATKDKSWLVDEERYKDVWRSSAQVAAVLLVHGRIAGTWRYERKAQELRVLVRPFSRLTRAVSRAVQKEADAVADFFGLQSASVE